jgi:putative ABC transport system substrate-binding protein
MLEYFIMAFRKIVKAAICLTLLLVVALSATSLTSSSTPTYKIGVIQTIEHSALDATCKGIRDELSDQGFKENLQWDWDSAQFNQSLATQIAQKFTGQEVNLIVAIATMAAQAALSVAHDKNIPVVFASVTDPKSAKLTGNITGVSNFIPVKEHFELISQILPDKKRIGVIYNPGDINSVTLVEQMQVLTKEKGFQLVTATVTKTSEVPAAIQSLVGKVDAVLINNDNTALAAFEGISQVCRDNKIPLFASDADVLGKGALAVRGPDQYSLGRQAGRMVAKILRGESKASGLGIEYPDKVGVYLNEKVAKELGIVFPESLQKESLQEKGNKS